MEYTKRDNGYYRNDGRKELGRDCAICGRSVKVEHHGLFRDHLSLKEFRITGLCQTCQDDIYATE